MPHCEELLNSIGQKNEIEVDLICSHAGQHGIPMRSHGHCGLRQLSPLKQQQHTQAHRAKTPSTEAAIIPALHARVHRHGTSSTLPATAHSSSDKTPLHTLCPPAPLHVPLHLAAITLKITEVMKQQDHRHRYVFRGCIRPFVTLVTSGASAICWTGRFIETRQKVTEKDMRGH
jgi:hypothetical protein